MKSLVTYFLDYGKGVNMSNYISKIKLYCQKILPLVYDDTLSYYEVLCKVTEKLNNVIDNENKISGYWNDFINKFETNLYETVKNIVDEYVKLGIISNILGLPYLDVTKYGAKGDGKTDDTESIQKCINKCAEMNLSNVYFPCGVYMVDGIVLPNSVTLMGCDKYNSVIKLKNNSTAHVITAGNYDTNADGVSKSEPIGCYNSGIKNISIDGNKENCPNGRNGIAYYGVGLSINNVVILNCNNIGLACEAPGDLHSATVGYSIQNHIDDLIVHHSNVGNMLYNGQSDSNLSNILLYETSNGYNLKLGSKSFGVRIVNLHVWGNSKYGFINDANRSEITNGHFESASVAKVQLNRVCTLNGCHFYQAPPYFNNDVGIEINNCSQNFITGRFNDIAQMFKISSSNYNYINVTGYSSNESFNVGFETSGSNDVIFIEIGGKNAVSIIQNHNTLFDSRRTTLLTDDGVNFHVRKRGNINPSVVIETSKTNDSYVSLVPGEPNDPIGGTIVVRGSGNRDLRLVPSGSGYIRFGMYTVGSVTEDGYITVKSDDGKVLRIPCQKIS